MEIDNYVLSRRMTFFSPPASLKSILVSLLIDNFEKRDIAIVDIPGIYLHAEMPKGKNAILKLTDKFVDIMC